MNDQQIKHRVSDFVSIAASIKEVSLPDEAVSKRNYKLEKAAAYGVRFKIDALLIVATTFGDVKIKSIIFEANERIVRLKGRVVIPTSSIKKVEFVL